MELTNEETEKQSLAGRLRQEMAYVMAPGNRMFQIVVRMRNEPGALASILALVNDRVDFRGVEAYESGDGGAVFSGFAEPLRPEVNPESIQRKIALSPSVYECAVTESSDGMLVDSFHKGVETENGDRLMLVEWDAINKMFDRVAKLFGTAGDAMLYYEGAAIGESNVNEVMGRLGRDVVRRNIPSVIQMLSASGWGDASVEISKSTGLPVVRMRDCFESSSKQRVRHGCSFMRGFLHGSARAILGGEVKCVETHCRLRGDDYCRFETSVVSPGQEESPNAIR